MSQEESHLLSRGIFPSVLVILVLASIASVDLADWKRRTSPASETYMKFIADWDTEYLSVAGDKGLFIEFEHLKGSAQEQAARVYFRAVYRLFPQRVVAAREGAVINTARQLCLANFQPDDRWLADRGIGAVLVVDGSTEYANPILMRLVRTAHSTTGAR
jgi:hypothetical protein